jgi:hypothetical protein
MFPLIALVAIAACDMANGPRTGPLAPEPAPDACGAVALQTLIGQPESVIFAMSFVEGTRIYRTGDALTMDFSPSRLNIEIGPAGTIVQVTCG